MLGALAAGALAQPNETTVTTQAAQDAHKVTGRLVTKAGDPVPGAIITLGDRSAISDGDGKFEVADSSGGTLKVDADGFAPRELAVTAGGQVVVEMDVALAGEEIVITGSRLPEKRLDAPVTIEVVTEKDLKTAAGVSYLSALSRVTGLDYSDSGIGDQRISARGFNTQFNSRMITMIDGRLAQMPGNGLPEGNLVPAGELDMKSVEVVIGPASALYGPNAHDGVINVVTKNPWDQSGAAISVRGGTHDLASAAGRVAGTIADTVGYKLNGEFLRARDFTPDRATHTFSGIYEGDLVSNFDIQQAKGDGSVYYKNGDWLATATGGMSDSTGFSLTNTGVNNLRDWKVNYETAQLSGPHVYAQVTRTGTDAGKTYQMDHLAALVAAMGGAPANPADLDPLRDKIALIDRSSMVDSDVQLRDTFAGIKGTLGAQYRHYMPVSEGTYLDDANQKIKIDEIGTYGQLDTTLFDSLRLAGAARVDHHSIYGTEVSPKASVQYEIASGQNVRVTYNRAYKAPTVLEDYLKISDVLLGNRTGFVVHDADGNVLANIAPLKPEQVDAFELGYKAQISNKAFVDAVAYQSYYHDFISPLTSVANPAMGTFATYKDGTPVAAGTASQGALMTYMNFGTATVRGGDLGVDYQPIEKLSLSGGVSAIKLASFENSNPLQNKLDLNVPTFKVRGSVQTDGLGIKNSFLRVDTRYHNGYAFESGHWSSSKLLNGNVPSRIVADITAGYRLPKQKVTISGTIVNMFDEQTPDVLGAPIPRRLMWLQLSYDWDGLRY
jgi:iron complex outermembrane receptor protein